MLGVGAEVYVTGSTGLRVGDKTTILKVRTHAGGIWYELANGAMRPASQVHAADDAAYWQKLGY